MFKGSFLVVLVLIQWVNCGILLWGSKNIQIPSLKQFNNEDFDELREFMEDPKVLAFQGDPAEIANDLQELLKNKHTAYIPNVNLMLDDIIELDGDAEENYNIIKNNLEEVQEENVLALIITTNDRTKRAADEETTEESVDSSSTTKKPHTTTMPITSKPIAEPIYGVIIYSAEGKAMMYTSEVPKLQINGTILLLGNATIVTLDNRGEKKFSRLSVTIPTSDGKVTLRFKFSWASGYWSLQFAEVLDMESKAYTLSVSKEITAPKRFSYHCSGETKFVNVENDIVLSFFDMQVQPDSVNGRFDDAYDCVNFMTAPIWSGLFVTSILCTVLGIGISALFSIKTMDKFDNSKTKPLTINSSD